MFTTVQEIYHKYKSLDYFTIPNEGFHTGILRHNPLQI